MTVAELGQRMSSRELSEWMAFYQLEPFGDEWRQAGQITAMVHNAAAAQSKHPKFRKAEDYMPIEQQPTEEVDVPDDLEVLASPEDQPMSEHAAAPDELRAKFAALMGGGR